MKKEILTASGAGIGVLGTATGLLALKNALTDRRAVRRRVLDEAEENRFQSEYGTIYYRKEGSGAPILLIHGLHPASSGCEWAYLVPYLAKEHTVFRVDLPGFGKSDKRMKTYTSLEATSVLRDFIRQMIGEKPVIVTGGASSALALSIEQSAPGTAEKLILINPHSLSEPSILPGKTGDTAKKLVSWPVLGTAVYQHKVSRRALAKKALLTDFYDPSRIPEDLLQKEYEAAHLGGTAAKAAYVSISSRFFSAPVLGVLKHLTVPVLLIGGEEEKNFDRTADEYIREGPEIRLEILEKTAHLPQAERPEETARLILSF